MVSTLEIAVRLSLAAGFGAIIGIERERKDWTAGMRTHMMVCLGSALAMLVSSLGFSDVLGNDHVELDPSRVAAQVVSGIGFIGAGTILFRQRETIRGLTTASGLWTVAAIGLATGGGMYFAAAATTILAIVILWLLHPIEERLSRRLKSHKRRIIRITTRVYPDRLLKRLWEVDGLTRQALTLDRGPDGYVVALNMDEQDRARLLSLVNEVLTDAFAAGESWSLVEEEPNGVGRK